MSQTIQAVPGCKIAFSLNGTSYALSRWVWDESNDVLFIPAMGTVNSSGAITNQLYWNTAQGPTRCQVSLMGAVNSDDFVALDAATKEGATVSNLICYINGTIKATLLKGTVQSKTVDGPWAAYVNYVITVVGDWKFNSFNNAEAANTV